jgi:hypothetical protein
MPFHCYGENSATFLIFNALSAGEGGGIRTLLQHLRQAGTGAQIDQNLVPDEEPVVWLFPNFGRRHGFGEPDALVLLGGHSFWFEVETRVNLATERPAARQSLLQLARFHLFHQALQAGEQERRIGQTHLAILGPTVSNMGHARDAVLRIKGHPVLKIRKSLAESTPHYVLMSVREARGVGGNGLHFGEDLGLFAQELFCDLQRALIAWGREVRYQGQLPETLSSDNLYYTYWYGHALRYWRTENNGQDPLKSVWAGWGH